MEIEFSAALLGASCTPCMWWIQRAGKVVLNNNYVDDGTKCSHSRSCAND